MTNWAQRFYAAIMPVPKVPEPNMVFHVDRFYPAPVSAVSVSRIATDKLGDKFLVFRGVPSRLSRGRYTGEVLRAARAWKGAGRPPHAHQ
jgi:hypothetical protein